MPLFYLVISNISKRANVRKLLMTAAAFGCERVLMVGQARFDLENDVPESIRDCGMVVERFPKWNDCTEWLRERQIRLVGIEIHDDAKPIEHFLDGVDTAFCMGNEGTGMLQKHMDSCDAFVRIPQYGGGTASLNVYVATTTVLYHFHLQNT